MITMREVDVEMITDPNITFSAKIDYQIVQLMMNSDFISISSNTIRVETKEVTDKGLVRFFGTKVSTIYS
jgi:hypothetical protein